MQRLALALICTTLFVSACADKQKCKETCGKAHHEAVTKCGGDEAAKAACEAKVDETHAACEAACDEK